MLRSENSRKNHTLIFQKCLDFELDALILEKMKRRPSRSASKKTSQSFDLLDKYLDQSPHNRVRKIPLLVFDRPRQASSSTHPALKFIYPGPIWHPKWATWTLDVQFWGPEHRGRVYGQRIIDLLDGTGLYDVIYHLTDFRDQHSNNAFAHWWSTRCTPCTQSVANGDIVYLRETEQYVIVRDTMPQNRTLLFPGYPSVIIGSGFKPDFSVYPAANGMSVLFSLVPAPTDCSKKAIGLVP